MKHLYEREGIEIAQGDCLDVMKLIDAGSIDLVLTDPPYGTTQCKWDSVIPFAPMWEQLERVIKPAGAIVLMAGQPFTSALVMSNAKMFRYGLVWRKSKAGHFAQAPYRFMTEHEDVAVFSFGGTSKNAAAPMTYNPQGLQDCRKICRGKAHSDHRPSEETQPDYLQTKTGYPKSVIEISSEQGPHPTQKPVALMEYLIRTYTDEGETVLDFTMGSGITLVAARNTGRRAIGIELEEKYCAVAIERLAALE